MLSDDFADQQVGWRDAEHLDRPRLVVVVVDLRRIVGIDVAGQRVFEDDVVGVAPDGDEIFSGAQRVGEADADLAEVALTDAEIADMGERAEQDVALVGTRAAFVEAQPDAVGPAVERGHFATRRLVAEVADLVADFDAGAVHGLVRGHDVAGDEVAEGYGVDGEVCCARIVRFVLILVDLMVAVGDDDQIGVATPADRDVEKRCFCGVAFAGCQGAGVGNFAEQRVAGAQRGVGGQVDPVGPAPVGRRSAEVVDRVADGGGSAGGDLPGDDDAGHAQIGAFAGFYGRRFGSQERVVVARCAMLVDLVATATAAEHGVADHLEAIEAVGFRRQA